MNHPIQDVTLSAPRSAYIHVPFCARRCGYCNFTLIAGRDDLIDRYVEAIQRELSELKDPRPVDTLFFGGGTPTHLPLEQLEALLQLAQRWFPLAEGHEFSVEANPANLDRAKVQLLARYGVNRISLGAQSFNPRKLELLDRDHRAADIVRAVQAARAEIESVSLDLIFAVPGESVAEWETDLETALELDPDHLSTYGLTFEQGTDFWSRRRKGSLVDLGEEDQCSMYELAIDRLTAAGFEHYEVSNFAGPERRCRHNEAYWAGQGYYAAGPGAARYVDGRREINHRSTTTWLKRVLAGQSPVAEAETLDPEDRARELLVFSLRRLAGLDREDFTSRTGYEIDDLAGPALAKHVEWKLLEDDGRRIRLTRKGLLVSDAIWPDFLRV